MKPSSSRSEAPDPEAPDPEAPEAEAPDPEVPEAAAPRPVSPQAVGGLFDAVLARGAVGAAVGDPAWLQALLDVEAALARAQARAGLLHPDVAEEIAAACRAERFDLRAVAAGAAGSGNPVVPLVPLLRAAVPQRAAAAVHRGATSQDIIDSAAMLVAHRALGPILADLDAAGAATARHVRDHRDTPMIGRTLLRQAEPTTFGLRAAGWLIALDEAVDRLRLVRRERLAVQLGGAAGTLAGYAEQGPAMIGHLATELGLAEPVLPWHTDRVRIADLAGALGIACGVIAKIARDVTLLGQDEVGEVGEGRPGGSSALAHKRNPVAAISAIGGAAQAPGLIASLFAAMVHEHERAAGSWHAEWRPLRELLITTGSAAAWLRDCLEHLEIHPAAMRANLDRAAAAGIEAAGAGRLSTHVTAATRLVDRALRGGRP